MSFHWRGASEVVAGLVLKERLSANEVDATVLHVPYDRIVRMLQDGKKEVDVADTVGMQPLLIAKEAADNSKGDPYPYLELLQRSSVRSQVGERLEPMAKSLSRGEDVDVAEMFSLLGRLELGYNDFTPLSSVSPEPSIYIPSYYAPLDKFVGGYPASGLTIVAGITGTGKTTFLLELAKSAAKKKKKCAILTLEMTMKQVVYRMLEVAPDLTQKQKGNILLAEDVYTVDEVYASVSRVVAKYPGLHFVGIDYADMMVADKEQSEPVMGRVYTSMALLAKKTRVPIVLITQYRRIQNGVPTIEDIRYSGRAEQAASMILLLHNPGIVWSKSRMEDNKSEKIPYIEGMADIIVGKLRYKGKMTGIGAIKVDWSQEEGRWGTNGTWYSLSGKL